MLAALLGNLKPPEQSSKVPGERIDTRLEKIRREDEEILELLTIITMSGITEE